VPADATGCARDSVELVEACCSDDELAGPFPECCTAPWRRVAASSCSRADFGSARGRDPPIVLRVSMRARALPSHGRQPLACDEGGDLHLLARHVNPSSARACPISSGRCSTSDFTSSASSSSRSRLLTQRATPDRRAALWCVISNSRINPSSARLLERSGLALISR